MSTGLDGNTLSAEKIANNVASVQNFVKEFGSDSKIWNQISGIVQVVVSGGDNSQSDVSFNVKDKGAFVDALKKSKDAGGDGRFIYLGDDQGHKDSTRGFSENPSDPSAHLESYSEHNFYVHWDPTTAISRSAVRDAVTGQLPVAIGKGAIAGLAHLVMGRAKTSAVKELLKREAQTPRK